MVQFHVSVLLRNFLHLHIDPLIKQNQTEAPHTAMKQIKRPLLMVVPIKSDLFIYLFILS